MLVLTEFTGAHKERFDESGRGKGKAGRTQGDAPVGDISEILGTEKRVNAAVTVVDHGSDTEDDASD